MKTTYLILFQGLAESPGLDGHEPEQYQINPKYMETVARKIAAGFGISDDDMFNIIQDFNEMCLKKKLKNINHSYCIWGIVQACKNFLRDKKGVLSYDVQGDDFKYDGDWIKDLLNND